MAKFLSFEDAETLRTRIISKYGSVNKLAKAINVTSSDMYSVLAGTKPFFPKYERLIKSALETDLNVYEIPEYKRIKEILADYWLSGKALSVEVNIKMRLKDESIVDKTIKWKE